MVQQTLRGQDSRLGALLIFEWASEAQARTARWLDGSTARRVASEPQVTLGVPDQDGKGRVAQARSSVDWMFKALNALSEGIERAG